MGRLSVLMLLFLLHAGMALAAPPQPQMLPKYTLTLLRPDGTPAAQANFAYALGVSSGKTHSVAGGSNGGHITDRNGRYLWQDAPVQPFQILVAAPGIGYGKSGIENPVRDRMNYLTIRLHTGGTISGTVLDLISRRPLGGMVVAPFREESPQDDWWLWDTLFGYIKVPAMSSDLLSSVSRDGDGSFLLTALPPGNYRIKVGLPVATIIAMKITGEEIRSGIHLFVPEPKGAVSVSGRIVRRNGVPVAHTEVRLVTRLDQANRNWSPETSDWVPRRVVTDARGRFTLYPLIPERYWITAWAAGFTPSDRQAVTVGTDGVSGLVFIVK